MGVDPKNPPIELVSTTKKCTCSENINVHNTLHLPFCSQRFITFINVYVYIGLVYFKYHIQTVLGGGEQGHNLKQTYSPPVLNPSLIALISVSMQSVETSAKQSV